MTVEPVPVLAVDSDLVGRESEVERLRRFLFDGEPRSAALVVEGPAGIGKTSVWRCAMDEARMRGLQVLSSRPGADESKLEFVGTADLLDGVAPDLLEQLPVPQRVALDTAIFLDRGGPPTELRAVHTAVLAVLRALAERGRVVIAVDDVQWLDSGTTATLAFAARRLEDADIRFLLTERVALGDLPLARFELGLPSDRIRLGPLSFGAIGRLLHEQLGVAFPRAVARRLYEISAGNPLFALELARAIIERGNAAVPGQEIPLPEQLEAALADRVAALEPSAAQALLAVALSSDPGIGELRAVVGQAAVDTAVDLAVLVVDGKRVRAAHPLLGEVVKARSRAEERHELHRRFAAITDDEERRAMHLSLATSGEDADVAALVARAAERASHRGAATTAADLGERALRLTPGSDAAYLERVLQAATFDYRAGALERVTQLLGEHLAHFPPGQTRGEAALLLATSGPFSAGEVYARYRDALEDAGPASPLRAELLAKIAINLTAGRVDNVREAEAHAVESLDISTGLRSARHEKLSLAALMWARSLRGLPIDEQRRRYATIAESSGTVYDSGDRASAVALMWRGEVAAARAELRALLVLAEERGEEESHYAIRVQLCELELRCGRWGELATILDEWRRERHDAALGAPAALVRFQAWLAVGQGRAPDARVLAREAVEKAEAAGAVWHRLESLRAHGACELFEGDFDAACASLGEVWEHTRRKGVANPGAFPAAPDLVQALAMAGRLDEARDVLGHLAGQAKEQEHPWGQAAALASRGHLLLADRADAEAAAVFAEAAERFNTLGLWFEQARSLVGLGLAQRRLRLRRDARRTLEQAAARFDELAARGWGDKARAELAQIGGRPSSAGTLTPTERRVAELVAQGQSNKQAAAALFVSIGTVEAHLTRIYAKLGVRSRSELARLIARG